MLKNHNSSTSRAYFVFANSLTSFIHGRTRLDWNMSMFIGYACAYKYIEEESEDLTTFMLDIKGLVDIQNEFFDVPIPANLYQVLGANIGSLYRLAFRREIDIDDI